MPSSFGDLAVVANAFADAALDPSRWNAAMEAAAEATGSFGAVLLPIRGRTPLLPTTKSMQPTLDAYIRDGWVHRDERYRSLPTFMRRGVACEFDFTTPEEIAGNGYYQELLAPRGLRWFAGVKVGDGDDVWGLSLQRTIEQGPFAPEELERLASLSQRLAGAAHLARAFGLERIETALRTFEMSNSAAVVIDRLGEVVKLNSSAEGLLSPDLQIVKRRLVSYSREATASLDRGLDALIWSGKDGALHSPVVLPRRRGRPVLAYPSRLPGVATYAFSPGRAFVVLVDLDARPVAPGEDLIRAFGLTPAEAKLASRMLAEESLEAAAATLGIAYETSRNMLKAVFQKTGTHRQVQLAALLARVARERPARFAAKSDS